MKKLLRRLLCVLGLHKYELAKDKDGCICIYCSKFYSRYEIMADLHAGGGW